MAFKLEKVHSQIKIFNTSIGDTQNRVLRGDFAYLNETDPKFHKEIQKISDKKTRQNKVNSYFDTLREDIEKNLIVMLVAAFEWDSFELLKNAIGDSRKILVHKDGPNAPQTKLRQSLIKDSEDFFNAGGLKKLLENQLPPNLFSEYTNLIDYRHHLAHGERFAKQKSAVLGNDAYETLSQVIAVIRAGINT